MIKKIIFMSIMLLIVDMLVAQTDTIFDSFIENQLDINDDDELRNIYIDSDSFSELLLKINLCSDRDIIKIPYLNPLQKQNLIAYRNEFGIIYSYAELQAIDGFETFNIEKFKPYIDLSYERDKTIPYFKNIFKDIKGETVMRTSSKFNFANENISGLNFLLKSKFEASEKLSLGFVYEKDAGEAFYDTLNKIPEHLSGFIQMQSKNIKLILGDYYIQLGQGLTAWHGFSFYGGLNQYSQMMFPLGLRRKTSADECNYLSGVATEISFKNVKFTSYASYRNKDAVICVDSLTNKKFFTSIYNTGYHRNNTELENRNTLKEYTGGLNIEYLGNFFKLYTGGHYTAYDKEYLPRLRLENLFKTFGKNILRFNIGGNINMRNSVIYTEIAINDIKGFATVIGWYKQATALSEIDVALRFMNPQYVGFQKYAWFKKKGGEWGLTVRKKMILNRYISLSTLIDISTPTWISFNSYNLNPQLVCNLKSEYQFGRNSMSISYLYRKTSVSNTHKVLYHYNYIEQHRYRFDIELKPIEKLKLRSRLEFNVVKENKGYLLYQDIALSLNPRLNISLRLACFDVKNWNNRIYCYENDVLYSYASPVYYGNGYMAYLLTRYKINRKISLWGKLRYDKTFKDTFFSRLEITAQIIVKF